jgi:hypothetical protein
MGSPKGDGTSPVLPTIFPPEAEKWRAAEQLISRTGERIKTVQMLGLLFRWSDDQQSARGGKVESS